MASPAKPSPWFWWLIPFWGLIELVRSGRTTKGASTLLWVWIVTLLVTVGLTAGLVLYVRDILEAF